MLILLRIFGVWLLLLAMVAAVVDATKSLAGGGAWVVTPMGGAMAGAQRRQPGGDENLGLEPVSAPSCGTR